GGGSGGGGGGVPGEPRTRDTARPLRLLHVGDVRPVKDQTLLLAAAGRLRDAGVDFTLDIVGLDTMGGAMQTSDAARHVEAQTHWDDVMRHEMLLELMDRADFLAVTSRH